jgi:RNA polymerase sigma factor (TIGR02999 family)
MSEHPSITQLLAEWNQGSRAALDELTAQVYRELHILARKYLNRGRPNQTLQPTALINEAYLRLIDQSEPVHFENRSHFFGIAARLMRIVLVDYARAHYAAKRGRGTVAMVTLDETAALVRNQAPDVLQLDDALRQLATLDERKAKVIELRFFGGLTRDEIARTLGLTTATVKRDLRLAEAFLRRYFAHQASP